MARRVLHRFFPGDPVRVLPHLPCSYSAGLPGPARDGILTSVRATERYPYFWYHVCLKSGNDYATHWFSDEFVDPHPDAQRAPNRPVEPAEDALRVRVGSDVTVGSHRRPVELYRVFEMFIPILKGENVHCLLVNRTGHIQLRLVQNLTVPVVAEIVSRYYWKPVVAGDCWKPAVSGSVHRGVYSS